MQSDCFGLSFRETWLHHNMPDQAIALQGRTMFHTDRMQDREADSVFTSVMFEDT